MSDIPERFYVPTGPKLIDGFRAFRSYLEKVVAARGERLAPAWYQDSPEEAPQPARDGAGGRAKNAAAAARIATSQAAEADRQAGANGVETLTPKSTESRALRFQVRNLG